MYSLVIGGTPVTGANADANRLRPVEGGSTTEMLRFNHPHPAAWAASAGVGGGAYAPPGGGVTAAARY